MPTIIKGDATVDGANSYGDVVGYRAYWAARDDIDRTGTAVLDVDIQTRLIEATEAIDQLPFFGVPLERDDLAARFLQLPRRGLVVGPTARHLPVGHLLPEDSLPWTIEQATYELTEERRIEDCPLTRPGLKAPDALRGRSVSGFSRTFVNQLAQRRYPRAEALLSGLYVPAGTLQLNVT